MEKEKETLESSSRSNTKRIYISHDASNKGKEKSAPLLVVNDSENFSASTENYINVFGVKISSKDNRSNI